MERFNPKLYSMPAINLEFVATAASVFLNVYALSNKGDLSKVENIQEETGSGLPT